MKKKIKVSKYISFYQENTKHFSAAVQFCYEDLFEKKFQNLNKRKFQGRLNKLEQFLIKKEI